MEFSTCHGRALPESSPEMAQAERENMGLLGP